MTSARRPRRRSDKAIPGGLRSNTTSAVTRSFWERHSRAIESHPIIRLSLILSGLLGGLAGLVEILR